MLGKCGGERVINGMFVGVLLSWRGRVISALNKYNADGTAGIVYNGPILTVRQLSAVGT